MRLKSYIIEGPGRHGHPKRSKHPAQDEIAEILKRDCKQILKFYNMGQFLYRGIRVNASDPDFIEKKYHEDRKPKDTPKSIHDYMNKLYKKKFGWPVRNGISVTSSFTQASMYGNAYVFLPVDGFKFVYNLEIYDFTNDFVGDYVESPDPSVFYAPNLHSDFRDAAQDVVDDSKDSNLKGAFGYQREIMFWCKKYYLLSHVMDDIIKTI